MLTEGGDRHFRLDKHRRITHSLFSQLKLKKKANTEGFSSELRRQHIDFFLDEVSETSFTAVVIMVEHRCLTNCTSPTSIPAAILETIEGC